MRPTSRSREAKVEEHNRHIRALAEQAMQEQSLRRSRIFLDAAIESMIIDAGVSGTVACLKTYVDQLEEFERG